MKEIKDKTDILLENVQDAIAWSELNDDEIVRNGLEKPFKSIRRNLNVIRNALNKRPSIAIFGQSQVGKSYLVQNLAKPFDSQYLKIKVSEDKEDINFLTEMNPDGGQESTGLVTRFTTNKNIPVDEAFPFEAELFSQLDIVAILVNAFWSDLKNFDESVYDFDQLELKALFDDLKTDTKQDGVTEDETYFFIKYIEDHFKDLALIRKLKRIGYFKDLETKLHLIAPEDRSKVLKYLWGQNTFFNHLFNLLTEQIKNLNFQRKIRLNLNALTPQSKTILDVERIREVLDNNEDFIQVKLNNAKVESSSRSLISILTKEVQLQLPTTFDEDNPQSFLNTSDLLDFPGSKSREKIPLTVFNNNSTVQKLQLLIRGKVSYLFDSYTNELGVSTLLYCMDDSPPEEKEAPNRLFKWVKKYVGGNQDARSKTLSKTKEILSKVENEVSDVSPLLVVFTKFNQELNKVLPGRESSIETHDSKWSARFGENFLNFMSRPVEDKWITKWTNNESNFRFIFPIRDPLYSQATFEGFESEGSETGIRPERKEAMRAMETSFTEAAIVKQHTIAPYKIWNEISTPNGTGIIFLSEQLKNSAHPIVTKTRLELDLNKIQSKLLEILEPYQVSGSLDEDLKKARLNGALAYSTLIALANKNNSPLHTILSSLVISDTEIWNLLYDHIFGMKKEEITEEKNSSIDIVASFKDLGVQLTPGMTEKEILVLLREVFEGLSDEEIKGVIESTFSLSLDKVPNLIANDNALNSQEELADIIISFWTESILNSSMDENILVSLNEKEKEHFRSILAEIIKGRSLFNLRKIITDTIKDIKTGTIAAEDIDLVASCCSTILNKFLFSAGWSFAPEDTKPLLPNEQEPIFSEHGKVYQNGELNYSLSTNKEFFSKWSFGCRRLYIENVKFQYNLGNTKYNSMANQKLNRIITALNSKQIEEFENNK